MPPTPWHRPASNLDSTPLQDPRPTIPKRLVRSYSKPAKPTPLSHKQIEDLIAKADAKTQRVDISEPWTAVPNPVPDTGVPTTAQREAENSPTTTVPSSSSTVPTATHSSLVLPLTTLPPIRSLGLASSPVASSPNATSSAAWKHRQATVPWHGLSVGAISLIAVAGAFLFLSLFVFIKLYSRPARKPRPVPSRPILDARFSEEDEKDPGKPEESPVFGGKERMSERPENSGIWNWTQYPTSGTTNVTSTVVPSVVAESQRLNEKNAHPGDSSERCQPSNYPLQVQNALSRAASRFSVTSASIYPASQLVTSFTADGHPVLERISSAKVLKRSRSSTLGDRPREPSQSRSTRYSTGLAYDGAQVTSPRLTVPSPILPVASTPAGRTPIKSSYYSHPRSSSMPRSKGLEAGHGHKPSASRPMKTLPDSPATIYPSSPQPTLFPDDSLSVVATKKQPFKNVHKKPAPSSNRMSRAVAPAEASTALGSLMLVDYETTADKRADDKPPRVPSPPPLPSLAQMGLEHVNPDAYVDYRSPTYSICNFYESDRKSRSSLHPPAK